MVIKYFQRKGVAVVKVKVNLIDQLESVVDVITPRPF
jgi:hypothetical protein